MIRSPPATSAHSRYAGVGFFISALSLTRSRDQKNSVWRYVVGLYGRVSRFEPNRPLPFLNNRGGYLRPVAF